MMIPVWKDLFTLGLKEDNVAFDWTARTLASALTEESIMRNKLTATLIAKEQGVWAGELGLRALSLLSAEWGSPIEVTTELKNGSLVSPKTKIATLRGNGQTLLGFERTLINLVSYASGIATQTHALVEQVRAANLKAPPRITATRKTLPGYKELAVESTLIGGARPHRYNLSGGLLLKENHIAALGGIERAVQTARNVVPHLLKIEVEVRNMDELKQAIATGAEVIMLDNFTPSQIVDAVKLKPKSGVTFEVSGGIHIKNIRDYCIEGLDVISVGSITHSVKSLDLSLLMETLI